VDIILILYCFATHRAARHNLQADAGLGERVDYVGGNTGLIYNNINNMIYNKITAIIIIQWISFFRFFIT